MMTALGVSLTFPIIQSFKSTLRGHCWVNMGSLFAHTPQNTNYSGLSIGTGVIVKILNIARLEVNCGQIFSFPASNTGTNEVDDQQASHDYSSRFIGPSINIGVEFL